MDFSLINRFCFNTVIEKSLRGSTEFIYIYIYYVYTRMYITFVSYVNITPRTQVDK